MSELNSFPLLNAQSELLLVTTGSGKKAKRYSNMVGFCVSEKSMNLDFAQTAWNKIVEDNDSLRIRIHKKNTHYYQTFEPYFCFELPLRHYISSEDVINNYGKIWVDTLSDRLWTAELYTTDSGENGLCVALNHLCCDGYSLEMMFSQFERFYNQLCSGNELSHIKKPGSYKVALEREKIYLKSDSYRDDRLWWKKTYKKQLHSHHCIPTGSRIRGGDSSYAAVNLGFDTTQDLVAFAQKCQVTLQSLIFSSCAFTIFALTGKTEFSIFVLNHGRTFLPLRNTMGCMVIAVPVQVNLDPTKKIVDSVRDLYLEYLESMQHARFPNVEQLPMYIMKSMLNGFNFAINWFTYSAMNYQRIAEVSPRKFRRLKFGYGNGQLYLGMNDGANGLHFDLEYLTSMFSNEQADKIMSDALDLARLLPLHADKQLELLRADDFIKNLTAND